MFALTLVGGVAAGPRGHAWIPSRLSGSDDEFEARALGETGLCHLTGRYAAYRWRGVVKMILSTRPRSSGASGKSTVVRLGPVFRPATRRCGGVCVVGSWKDPAVAADGRAASGVKGRA